MGRYKKSISPGQTDVAEHYASGYEAGRLDIEAGKLERERSRELIERFLPPPPAIILDVGGGTGAYSYWLAKLGYTVHLIDIVPLHVDLAKEKSDLQPEAPLASITVGDARSLKWENDQADGILLFGPMYHLTDREDRLRSLREAWRVLKKNGILIAVGISRFASAMDGLRSGFLKDPEFAAIVDRDLQSGQHKNPTEKQEYFMDTFFHHPAELRNEIKAGGFEDVGVFGVEGPGWLVHDFDGWWNDENLKNHIITLARRLETESSLLGISAHLIAVGRK
jgi:ubiquinone/menaquinone biosynthesis C-methylase UbiE